MKIFALLLSMRQERNKDSIIANFQNPSIVTINNRFVKNIIFSFK